MMIFVLFIISNIGVTITVLVAITIRGRDEDICKLCLSQCYEGNGIIKEQYFLNLIITSLKIEVGCGYIFTHCRRVRERECLF